MTKKPSKPSQGPRKSRTGSALSSPTAAGTTSSGPSHPGDPENSMAAHAAEQEALAAGMPSNENKPLEYGYDNAVAPSEGASSDMPSPTTGAGTLRTSERRRGVRTRVNSFSNTSLCVRKHTVRCDSGWLEGVGSHFRSRWRLYRMQQPARRCRQQRHLADPMAHPAKQSCL